MASRQIVAVRMPGIDLLDSPASSSYFEVREHKIYYRALHHHVPARHFHAKLIPMCTRFIELTSIKQNEALIDELISWSANRRRVSSSANRRKMSWSFQFLAAQARERHPYGYRLLGLGEPLTLETLKKGYREAALRHHPDRGGSHEAMVTINEAYTDIYEMLLQQQLISEAAPDPMENPRAGAARILTCRDFRYEIGLLLLAMNMGDWAVDEAFRWLKFLITGEWQQSAYTHDKGQQITIALEWRQSAYARDDAQQNILASWVTELATRLTLAGMWDQARFCLEVAKKNFSDVRHVQAAIDGIWRPRFVLNHIRQTDNALRLNIIDRKQYDRAVTRLSNAEEKRRARDAVQEAALRSYVATPGFLKDLPPDAISVGKVARARLVPDPACFRIRIADLDDDQQAEYAATFGPQATLEKVKKYTYVRLQSLLETTILPSWKGRLEELKRECRLFADIYSDPPNPYAVAVVETLQFLTEVDADEREVRLAMLRNAGVLLYPPYGDFARRLLQELQGFIRTGRVAHSPLYTSILSP